MDRVLISHTVPLGDGTVQVHYRTPGGEWGSVVVGHDVIESGQVYDVLARHAATVDTARAALAAHEAAGGTR